MHRLWKFNVSTVSDVVFAREYVVLSSGNKLLCFDRSGLLWSYTMNATFYRDPYGDVAITALDAEYPYIAAGTNFMDGKLYLFTIDGKLHWGHQFATTASLGWRPEDVTAVKVGNGIVCAGTEFMNEYIYVYTVNRKRVLQQRVKARVKDFLLLDDGIVVGTGQYLYMISLGGRTLQLIRMPVEKLGRVGDTLIVLNRKGVTALDVKEFAKIWGCSAENAVIYCCGDEVLVATEKNLKCLSKDGELLWRKHFDEKIVCLHYDDSYCYVGVKNRIFVLYDDVVREIRVEGTPLRFGEGVVVIKDRGIGLYDYTE